MENKLKKRLKIAKKSYGWMEIRTKIKREYLCRLANDKVADPRISTCLKIARALDVPVEKLWSLE